MRKTKTMLAVVITLIITYVAFGLFHFLLNTCTFLLLLMYVPCIFLSLVMSVPCPFLSVVMSVPCTLPIMEPALSTNVYKTNLQHKSTQN